MKQYTKIIAAILINSLAYSFAAASTIPAKTAPVSSKETPSKPLDKSTLLKRIEAANAYLASPNVLNELADDVAAYAVKNTDDKSLIYVTSRVQGYAADLVNILKMMNNKVKIRHEELVILKKDQESLEDNYNVKLKKVSYYVPSKRSVKEVLMKFADLIMKQQKDLILHIEHWIVR